MISRNIFSVRANFRNYHTVLYNTYMEEDAMACEFGDLQNDWHFLMTRNTRPNPPWWQEREVGNFDLLFGDDCLGLGNLEVADKVFRPEIGTWGLLLPIECKWRQQCNLQKMVKVNYCNFHTVQNTKRTDYDKKVMFGFGKLARLFNANLKVISFQANVFLTTFLNDWTIGIFLWIATVDWIHTPAKISTTKTSRTPICNFT